MLVNIVPIAKCPSGDAYCRSGPFIYCTLTGPIWVFLISCLLLRPVQWKCVLSEPLCAYTTCCHWWITTWGSEPVRTQASWAWSYSSETSSTFQWCKWRHPSYSSERSKSSYVLKVPFLLIGTFLECCLKWPTAECKNESWSFFCQRNPQSFARAGLNIYWRNIVTKLN